MAPEKEILYIGFLSWPKDLSAKNDFKIDENQSEITCKA